MAETQAGKMNDQETALEPLPKRESPEDAAELAAMPQEARAPKHEASEPQRKASASPQEPSAPPEEEAKLRTAVNRALKTAWPDSPESTFPPMPSPFAPPQTLWADLSRPSKQRPDPRANGLFPAPPASPSEAGKPAAPAETRDEPPKSPQVPASQQADLAFPGESSELPVVPEADLEPRRGTLTDTTPAYARSSRRREEPDAVRALQEAPSTTGGAVPAPPGEEAPAPEPERPEPTRLRDAGRAGKAQSPRSAPDPGKPEPAQSPKEQRKKPQEVIKTAAPPRQETPIQETPIDAAKAVTPTGEADPAADDRTYSHIRNISRGHWRVTLLSSLGITLFTATLILLVYPISRLIYGQGWPTVASLPGRISQIWTDLTSADFIQLIAITLPVLLVFLTPLYIAFSIQGNRIPDRDSSATNEQVALQQVRESVVLILAGLTGTTIALTIPWITVRAPILLFLPVGGVLTCGFMIAVRARSLENDRMRLTRSTQQETALSQANANEVTARLGRRGRERSSQEGSKSRREKKTARVRSSREDLLRHMRWRLLATHFTVLTLLAVVGLVPLIWYMTYNVASPWVTLSFSLLTIAWIRFFWGYTFTTKRKDVLAEAMKPGNNRLARSGAWAVRTIFECTTALTALAAPIVVPGSQLTETNFTAILVVESGWYLVVLLLRWVYQQFSRTGRGIRQLDRRLALLRLRREIAALQAGTTSRPG